MAHTANAGNRPHLTAWRPRLPALDVRHHLPWGATPGIRRRGGRSGHVLVIGRIARDRTRRPDGATGQALVAAPDGSRAATVNDRPPGFPRSSDDREPPLTAVPRRCLRGGGILPTFRLTGGGTARPLGPHEGERDADRDGERRVARQAGADPSGAATALRAGGRAHPREARPRPGRNRHHLRPRHFSGDEALVTYTRVTARRQPKCCRGQP